MPSPLDVPNIKGINPKDGSDMERRSADDEPMSALAFKIMNDPFVGTLTFVRVYSGAPAYRCGPITTYTSVLCTSYVCVLIPLPMCVLVPRHPHSRPLLVLPLLAACICCRMPPSTYYLYLCVCSYTCACVVAPERAASYCRHITYTCHTYIAYIHTYMRIHVGLTHCGWTSGVL